MGFNSAFKGLIYGWACGTNTLLTLDILYISTHQYNCYRLFCVLQHKYNAVLYNAANNNYTFRSLT